jgi:hypothetical protein
MARILVGKPALGKPANGVLRGFAHWNVLLSPWFCGEVPPRDTPVTLS